MRTVKIPTFLSATIVISAVLGCDVDSHDTTSPRAYELVESERFDGYDHAVVEADGELLEVVVIEEPMPLAAVLLPDGDVIIAGERDAELHPARVTGQGAVEQLSMIDLGAARAAVLEDALAGELLSDEETELRRWQDDANSCGAFGVCAGGCSAQATNCINNPYQNGSYCEGQMNECWGNCVSNNLGCFGG